MLARAGDAARGAGVCRELSKRTQPTLRQAVGRGRLVPPCAARLALRSVCFESRAGHARAVEFEPADGHAIEVFLMSQKPFFLKDPK